MEHQEFKIHKEKQKMFSNKKIPKIQFTIEIAWVRPIFGHKINFTVNIWKQSRETVKTNGSWWDIISQKSIIPFKIKCQVKNVFREMSKAQ